MNQRFIKTLQGKKKWCFISAFLSNETQALFKSDDLLKSSCLKKQQTKINGIAKL